MKPIGKKLILRPSASNLKGQIEIPEQFRNAIGTSLVMGVGNKVHPLINVGDVVMSQVMFEDRQNKLNELGDFLVDEHRILGKLMLGSAFTRHLYPLGTNILFERDKDEEISKGGIVIPSTVRSKRQSLWGWVRRHGLLRPKEKRRVSGIQLNSHCMLTRWEEHYMDFTMEGKHYLIIQEKDLLCELCEPSL